MKRYVPLFEEYTAQGDVTNSVLTKKNAKGTGKYSVDLADYDQITFFSTGFCEAEYYFIYNRKAVSENEIVKFAHIWINEGSKFSGYDIERLDSADFDNPHTDWQEYQGADFSPRVIFGWEHEYYEKDNAEYFSGRQQNIDKFI